MLETAKALQDETPWLKYVLPLANKISITGTASRMQPMIRKKMLISSRNQNGDRFSAGISSPRRSPICS